MEINDITLSIVSISDSLIEKVAIKCQTSTEKVKEYLQSANQDDKLLEAFLFYGVGPLNKFSSSCKVCGDK